MKNLWNKIRKWLHQMTSRLLRRKRPSHNEISLQPSLDLSELLYSLDITTRIKAHHELRRLLQQGANDEEIAHYALGNVYGPSNYCAQKERDHGNNLSVEIKENNPDWVKQVAKLTKELYKFRGDNLLVILDRYYIDYLKISIASEIAMILHPQMYSVINKRTMYAYYKGEGLNIKNKQGMQYQEDKELIKDILLDYESWADLAGPVTANLDKLYQDKLRFFFPYPQYKYFYTEAFWSLVYEHIKEHGGKLHWKTCHDQLHSLNLPPFPLPAPFSGNLLN